jgi:hypothetical protein
VESAEQLRGRDICADILQLHQLNTVVQREQRVAGMRFYGILVMPRQPAGGQPSNARFQSVAGLRLPQFKSVIKILPSPNRATGV